MSIANLIRGRRVALMAMLAAFACNVAWAAVSFSPAIVLKYPYNPSGNNIIEGASVGDLNGDDRIDLILSTAGSGSETPEEDLLIFVFEGQPDGSLLRVKTFPYSHAGATGYANRGMALGDFDEDGKDELLLLGPNDKGADTTVVLLKQNPARDFDAVLTLPCPFRIIHAVAKDFDGDGHLDILGSGEGMGGLVYKGTGNLTFLDPVYVMFFPINFVNFADLDGDGRDDLLTATDLGTGVVGYSIASSPNFFNPPERFLGAHRDTTAVGAGDFTGDGIPELIELHKETVEDENNTQYRYSTIGIHKRQLDGSWIRIINKREREASQVPMAIITRDIDNDGDTDVIAFHGAWTDVMLQDDGTLANPIALEGESYSLPRPDTVHVIDFNADGCLDIGFAAYYSYVVHLRLDCAQPAARPALR